MMPAVGDMDHDQWQALSGEDQRDNVCAVTDLPGIVDKRSDSDTEDEDEPSVAVVSSLSLRERLTETLAQICALEATDPASEITESEKEIRRCEEALHDVLGPAEAGGIPRTIKGSFYL